MIELERTYLVKVVPANLTELAHKEVFDIYFPQSADHPVLRLRKNGDKYEMTKKQPVKDGDASKQLEQTISLTQAEFQALSQLPGKKVRKLRYNYDYQGHAGEIDVFQDELAGLVVADFEFTSEEDKDRFGLPDFCLADITQETFVAGGMICGKTYADIAPILDRYNYQKLTA